MIYLDYNATAPLKKTVREAMLNLPLIPLNPSSIHGFGREARRLLEEARSTLLKAVNGEGYRLIFTASGTEANNLALKGLAGYTVMISAVEHLSVLKSVEGAIQIPVDGEGRINIAALEELLAHTKGPKLVSVMLANNETGVVQQIVEIAALAHHYGAIIHSDAVQALGKIPIDMQALGVDMLSISAHKCGGPQGMGALLVKKNLHLAAVITGGGQEQGFRAGTENIAGAVGFATAIPPKEEIEEEQTRLTLLQQKLETTLAGKAVIMGAGAERLAGTCSIAMPGVSTETQLIHFDLNKIAISSGSACSSGRLTTSYVLLMMGIEKELAGSVVRVSMGRETTAQDIDKFISVWNELYQRKQ